MKEIISPSLWTLMVCRLAQHCSCSLANNLKAMVLICEYSMLFDQHALAFVVFGCCYRIMRLLGLDSLKKLTDSYNPTQVTQAESERRVLWSCYILDSFLGGGVDDNLFWKDDVPRVPLPCSDGNFIAQTQPSNHDLPTIESFQTPADFHRLNLRSHIIHLARLRTRVLRYPTSKIPLHGLDIILLTRTL